MFEDVIIYYLGKTITTILLHGQVIYLKTDIEGVGAEYHPLDMEKDIRYRVDYGFGGMQFSTLEECKAWMKAVDIKCNLFIENGLPFIESE